jgi:hypothetical protein
MTVHVLTTSEGDGAGHRAFYAKPPTLNFIAGYLRSHARGHGGDHAFHLSTFADELQRRADLPPADLDELADLLEVYTAARDALDAAPLGRFGTGSNDAEQNALYVAEQVVRDYWEGHR